MKNLSWALAGALLLLYACKKDDAPNFANFANLEVGNYWVYDLYQLDTNGVYTIMAGKTDSVLVEKDTVIGGETYFKIVENQYGLPDRYASRFLRDSLHYLVDWRGNIFLSSENFTDTLRTVFFTLQLSPTMQDTAARITAGMTDANTTVQTPAGSFNTINYRERWMLWPKYAPYGNLRYQNHRYAEGVGLVEQTLGFFIADPGRKYIVRRLRAYGQL